RRSSRPAATRPARPSSWASVSRPCTTSSTSTEAELMALGLRARQAVALGVAVLLVVAGSTVAHLASVARVALRGAGDEGALLGGELHQQSSRVGAESPQADPLLLQRDPGIRAMLEGIVGYSHTVVYAAIVDPSDRILAHSNPKLNGKLLPPQESLDQVKTWW